MFRFPPLVDESCGIGRGGRLQHLLRRADFDHLAVAKHHDAMRDLRHDREIMGDVETGGAEFADEIAQEREHLDLRRHVERGGRLVEHDHVGAATHRHGRHRALQLAAGHLVRIAVPEGIGVRQVQGPEQADARRLRASARVITPWVTGASQTCSINVIAGLNEAAALCAI